MANAVVLPMAEGWGRRLVVTLARGFFPVTVAGWARGGGVPGPCIFAADHGSHLDSIAILAALPEAARARLRVAAAEDYWYADRLRRAAAATLGAFPFPRKGLAGVDRAAALLAAGQSVLIYPEGSRGGGPFRPGVGLLATRAGVPVVPVAVRGGRACWPKGRALPRRGPIAVAFGTPLRFGSDVAPLVATRRIEAAVRALAAGGVCEATTDAA